MITRFAPSPTGFLHIGGARTALFNWLLARHFGGQFLLRIEDTDRKRSTQEAVDAILEGMSWLGLDHDGDIVYQYSRRERHVEIAEQLLAMGHAYYCYCTPEELTEMRETARAEGRPIRYDGRWRDRSPADAPPNTPPVIRFKSPRDGETLITDLVQGDVRVNNNELDDMVLLRADGSPTYMLSVVVDDHDMGITHIVRGDDHLTNAFRQKQIFIALGWDIPEYAHIPLIHGSDGAKLSKRHGALGVDAYRDMGYLPETLRNYLLRLGWAHGDDEVITKEQAIEWFSVEGIGKSPSRFDMAKLDHLNGLYMRDIASNHRLLDVMLPKIEAIVGHNLSAADKELIIKAIDGLKLRAKNINELAQSAAFYVAKRPLVMNEKALNLLDKEDSRLNLATLLPVLERQADWQEGAIEAAVKDFVEKEALKLGKVAQPLRAALTGSNSSPGIFEVLELLGKEESIARIKDQLL
ncbi:MAG: glutamate--tRNA ligase [Kordiimonas sp.]|nr:glutamate--tRNA ligase [Kordiimonas sp.]|tara:strand:+ start:371 stop:1771 length:1401 start_codon:yes stop_codon:yes gene_type:complete